MPEPLRRLARVAALLSPVFVVFAVAAPASAAPPITWKRDDSVSTLEYLLLIVGAPLGLFVLLALLTMAPSIAKGTPYRSHVPWYDEPMQFGTEPRAEASTDATVESTGGGGAHVRW